MGRGQADGGNDWLLLLYGRNIRGDPQQRETTRGHQGTSCYPRAPSELVGGGGGRGMCAYLAEIERLLLLEVWSWPLLPVGNCSRRAP